jgi:hypothetical protein
MFSFPSCSFLFSWAILGCDHDSGSQLILGQLACSKLAFIFPAR